MSKERQIKHSNVLHWTQNATACASLTEETASKNSLTATHYTLSCINKCFLNDWPTASSKT